MCHVAVVDQPEVLSLEPEMTGLDPVWGVVVFGGGICCFWIRVTRAEVRDNSEQKKEVGRNIIRLMVHFNLAEIYVI